jgi:hypothetical protein
MSEPATPPPAIAFHGNRRVAVGPVTEIADRLRRLQARGSRLPIMVFDLETSEALDLDLRPGAAVLPLPAPRAGYGGPARSGPGRPRLGVVAREVTLLPRHWEWLNDQPGGASVTLRKLVDQARQANGEIDRVRKARESAYRFILAMAGDRPGFEEATRALFAGDKLRFHRHTEQWPADVKAHARTLMERTL